MIRNRLAKAAALSAGAVVVALGIAGPAFAHVTVNPNSATQGGYTRVAFRVPNESDTASTTKLEVVLPEDAPVASVSTMPVAGWTVAVEQRKLATPLEVHGSQVSEVIGKITWTATAGAEIKPGQFQEFPVSMGPLPDKDQMIFKSLQTYSDGEVVRWIDEPVEGGEEPEHPAPVLKLAKAADEAAPTAGPTVAAEGGGADEGSSSGAAVGLGIAGLVAGVLGLVLGGLAFVRTRRSA